MDILDEKLKEWHAGVELELMGVFGLDCEEDRVPYRGLGQERRSSYAVAERRHRHTPDWQGVLGHRLAWAARQLHDVGQQAAMLCEYGGAMVEVHGRAGAARRQSRASRAVRDAASCKGQADVDIQTAASHGLPWQYVIIKRIGLRAAALLRHKKREKMNAEDGAAAKDLQDALRLLASTARTSHGTLPLIDLWSRGDGRSWLAKLCAQRTLTDETHMEFARRRYAHRLKETRHWASTAAYKIAHKVTREPEAITHLSASAKKTHLGAANPQEAADEGIEEWSVPWDAATDDRSEDVMREIEATTASMDKYTEIPLPELDDEAIHQGGRSFHGRTAVGVCGLRPRHSLLVSRGARRALGKILMRIERFRRWPKAVWAVTEVALSKRTGGSRLVGLAATVYRMWARIRYTHCRALLEQRIERPYLAAAPRKGAARAAFEVARVAETAAARGMTAAGTMVDIASFYKYTNPLEYIKSALRVGLPKVIVALSAHLYLAPRRVKVRGAYSGQVFPRRSIVAGCTWATALIRIMVIPHIESFLEAARNRALDLDMDIKLLFMMYVDGALAMTTGPAGQVARFNAWVTRALIAWVKEALKKSVAWEKFRLLPLMSGFGIG